MKFTAPLVLISLSALPAAVQAQVGPELLDNYCTPCHNSEDWAGSLAIDVLDFEHVSADAKDWEKVIRKLSAGMMPPAGEPRPTPEEAEAFVTSLENRIDASAPASESVPALHRLNRNEYGNAIRDLLALDIDVSALLPVDNASEGFDNIASGLGFSPALIQGYTAAAMKVSRWATGDMTTTEEAFTYNTAEDLLQDRHLEGMPLGTRGGIEVTHNFPLDAEYEFNVRGGIGFGRDPSVNIVLTLDGERISPENYRRFRLPLTAGEHTLTASLLDMKHPAGVNDIYSEYNLSGSVSGIEIHGPFNATGTGDTLSRRQVFSCYPQSNDEEQACARQILGTLAGRAFRQPVSDQTLEPMMAFYARGYEEGGFESGIQQGLSRILIDPRFLFRFEEEPAGIEEGETYAISDYELASRLSFFLWSSIPDAALLEAAEAGNLHEPAVLRQQVARMIADSKADALLDNFAGQWLHLRQLETLTPETEAFNENLREAFIQETRLLFASVISDDLPVTQLLNADYTFLNQSLAEHYGIAGIHGDYFRRVELAEDSPRRGLLGQGSILTVTSTASRTSPVIRGSWILENLLHAPVPAPPPGVETNLDGDGSVVLTSSVRERLEAHRDNPSCHSCHSVIDPVGFALENFDMIGAWREYDGDSPVDASGTLVDGTPVQSPADLRQALMSRQELFVTTFTEKLMTYALGRGLEYTDMPAVRAILHESENEDYRFSAIVNAVVSSPAFLQRTGTGQGSEGLANR